MESSLTDLVGKFEASEESFADSNVLCERDRDYVDGIQWTDSERSEIAKRGQAPIVINRIKPKVDFLLGAERERRTDIKAYPRTPNDSTDAQVATEVLRYVADSSDWDVQRSRAFEDCIVEGRACVEISYRKRTDDIRIKHVRWDRVFYDPYAREPDLSDRTYAGVAIWMDLPDAVSKYPDHKDVLESSLTEGLNAMSSTYEDKPIARWVDPKRKRVRIVEIYCREDGEVYRTVFTRGGVLEPTALSAYEDEYGTVDPYEFMVCYMDREGRPYGVVRNLIDIQDEINKRRSKALHLLSVRQIKIERGAVDDVKKARKELSKPDGVVEVTHGDGLDILPTNDMAQGQFSLLQEAKSEIDSVGANAAMAGKEDRPMSGRALQSRAQSGYIEVAPLFDNLRFFQQRIFKKTWRCVRKFWNEEKWVRVTDNEENVRFLQVNSYTTDGNPYNNLAELDIDLIVNDAPDTVSIQMEQFQELAEMARSGLPIPPDAIIEASNIRNKDKILKRMRGEFESEEQQAAAQQQMELQHRAAMAEIVEKEARARDLMAKAEERMANVQIKIATLEQKGVQGLREIDADLEKADIKAVTELTKARITSERKSQA